MYNLLHVHWIYPFCRSRYLNKFILVAFNVRHAYLVAHAEPISVAYVYIYTAPTAYWSPYIFTLVQKIKSVMKIMLLYTNKGFAETLQVISFKNDLYFLHRRR